MSLLHLGVKFPEKPVQRHPWEKTIRPEFTNRIKYAHNSVNNPMLRKKCKKELKIPETRTRFKIFGDKFTDEFIHCSKIVMGLHKYRWKKFAPPVIKGVNSVEWPKILNDLKLQYGNEVFCLHGKAAVIYNDKFLGGLEKLKELVDSKYIYYLLFDNKKEVVNEFSKFIKSSGRPSVYMHIAIDDVHVGTLIFSLFSDIVPLTCENFLRRCREIMGGYSGTPIHRIVRDSWIQCGGFSLDKWDLACENFIVPFDKRGLLGMANDGRDIDCSRQFFVTLQPQQWMHYNYVAFGELIEGANTLQQIEEVPTWHEAPLSNIIIYRAGLLNLDCQDIWINPNAQSYIYKHIENLFALGNLLIKELKERLEEELDWREELINSIWDLVEEEIQQLEEGLEEDKSKSTTKAVPSDENLDFDVEDYEPEEYISEKVITEPSTPPEPLKNYYLPLTDVPYEYDTDSTYDDKKFLRGDYCLEADLSEPLKHRSLLTIFVTQSLTLVPEHGSAISQPAFSEQDLSSEELRDYLNQNIDRVSFAGGVIKAISRGYAMHNIFENATKSEIVNLKDDDLRRLRLINAAAGGKKMKKVAIADEAEGSPPKPIKRRQTGVIFLDDVEKLRKIQEQRAEERLLEGDDKPEWPGLTRSKFIPYESIVNFDTASTGTETLEPDSIRIRSTVRIATSALKKEPSLPIIRRPTGYSKEQLSVLSGDPCDAPTLKRYRPPGLLADLFHQDAPNQKGKLHRDSVPAEGEYQYLRPSLTVEDTMVLKSHQQKGARKSFEDSMQGFQKEKAHSLSSYAYAKQRPTMTVKEYKTMNRALQNSLRNSTSPQQSRENSGDGYTIREQSHPLLKTPVEIVQATSNIVLPVVSTEFRSRLMNK